MANIAQVLREEIRRLAKREIRLQTGKTQRAVVQFRRDIAALRKLAVEQAKQISDLQKHAKKPVGPALLPAEDKLRFSARSVKAQRKRLGMSAADYGKLVGVTPLTIYAWEQGKSRPRKAQLDAFLAVRGIGKREAHQKLAGLSVPAEKESSQS
jgi:DNA-binding transcriptional regulator YiaG